MNAIGQAKQTSRCLLRPAPLRHRVKAASFMVIDVQIHERFAHIALSGHFDFHAQRNFRESCIPLFENAAVREVRVEMSKVDYMDTPALGMLMLLNERGKAANKPVALLSASVAVSQALEAANCSRIFNIKRIRPENRRLPGLSPMIASNFPSTS